MFEWHGYGGGMMWIFWILIILAFVWFVAARWRAHLWHADALANAR